MKEGSDFVFILINLFQGKSHLKCAKQIDHSWAKRQKWNETNITVDVYFKGPAGGHNVKGIHEESVMSAPHLGVYWDRVLSRSGVSGEGGGISQISLRPLPKPTPQDGPGREDIIQDICERLWYGTIHWHCVSSRSFQAVLLCNLDWPKKGYNQSPGTVSSRCHPQR